MQTGQDKGNEKWTRRTKTEFDLYQQIDLQHTAGSHSPTDRGNPFQKKKRGNHRTGIPIRTGTAHTHLHNNGPGVIVPWLSSTQMRMDAMFMTQSWRLYSMDLKRRTERSLHMLTRRIGLGSLSHSHLGRRGELYLQLIISLATRVNRWFIRWWCRGGAICHVL
jgi:hypothetical protein